MYLNHWILNDLPQNNNKYNTHDRKNILNVFFAVISVARITTRYWIKCKVVTEAKTSEEDQFQFQE